MGASLDFVRDERDGGHYGRAMKLGWGIVAMLALTGAAHAVTPPRRILSLNLCADQYLVALADPAQVVGLTRLARDPAMSWEAAQAGRFPIGATSTEAMLTAQPDLVLTGWPGQADLAVRLGLKAKVLSVPPANSYADIRQQVRDVAAAIGQPARGAALIAHMDAALAAVPRTGRGKVAAEYQRRGFLTGGGTLTDEAMRRAGLVNLAVKLGRGPLSRLSLEEMVAARPDYLIVGGNRVARDQGQAMLLHPAIAAIPRLTLPTAALTCGGPSFVAAVQSLARQLRD